jgi:hypothetical protein
MTIRASINLASCVSNTKSAQIGTSAKPAAGGGTLVPRASRAMPGLELQITIRYSPINDSCSQIIASYLTLLDE